VRGKVSPQATAQAPRAAARPANRAEHKLKQEALSGVRGKWGGLAVAGPALLAKKPIFESQGMAADGRSIDQYADQ
jgi:hypothetical protein